MEAKREVLAARERKVALTLKRIAVVVSHPIQHFCPQYASWASIKNFEITVLFASRDGLDAYEDKDFGRTLKWDGLSLNFRHEFLPGADRRSSGTEIDCEQLPDRLAKLSPDMVVVYGYSQPLQRRAIKWARRNARPLAMIADSELRTQRPWLRRVAKSVLLPRQLRKIDVFLSVGDANESYYRRYGVPDKKLVRCFFPIDTKAFPTVRSDRELIGARLREDLGIPTGDIVILTVGKLVLWKRHRDLIEFSNLVQASKRDITVIIAGVGREEQSLRMQARRMGLGGVLFAGFVAPEDLVAYYAAADVYVHCSEREPHSLAISEAIYSGLPVVLSDRCGSYGPSDDVRPGLNGLVYTCGNIHEMSSSLTSIIDCSALRERMSRASEEIAHSNQALAHGKALVQAMQVISQAATR